MSGKGIKRSDNSRVDNLSQKKYRNSNQDEKTRGKSLPIHVKHSRRLVTPATKLSHEYEEFVTNTTASTKQRDHHQDSDSDNDDILSELSSPGNKKVPPFYPPIQGRSDDSPVTDNPKTNIMDLHLDIGDNFKYITVPP